MGWARAARRVRWRRNDCAAMRGIEAAACDRHSSATRGPVQDCMTTARPKPQHDSKSNPVRATDGGRATDGASEPETGTLLETIGAESGVEFYIPATSSILERRPRTLKHGNSFAVFDHYGDVIEAPRSPEGLYHEDMRHLSRLELLIEGKKPLLLSSTLHDDNSTLVVDP